MSRNANEGRLPPVNYALALEAQASLSRACREGRSPDLLWLLEHPATITVGKGAAPGHVLLGPGELSRRGIALHATPRGGDVTAHEPGQMVGYVIASLEGPRGRDLHAFIRALEEGLLRLLVGLGVAAVRVPGRTGVWIEGPPPRKVAAIGVRAQGWVTSHGFALNIDNDLSTFERIIPCGITDAIVTSLARELDGRPLPSWSELERATHRSLELALGWPLALVRGPEGLERAGALRTEAAQSEAAESSRVQSNRPAPRSL